MKMYHLQLPHLLVLHHLLLVPHHLLVLHHLLQVPHHHLQVPRPLQLPRPQVGRKDFGKFDVEAEVDVEAAVGVEVGVEFQVGFPVVVLVWAVGLLAVVLLGLQLVFEVDLLLLQVMDCFDCLFRMLVWTTLIHF